MSSTLLHNTESTMASHPAHHSHGPAIHVVIPQTSTLASASTTPSSSTTPGHGHANVRVRIPQPSDTPAHGHPNALFARPSPADTPSHGHPNVALFTVASPRGDSPATPTLPRMSARASRRSSFSGTQDALEEGRSQGAAQWSLASHAEESEDESQADVGGGRFARSRSSLDDDVPSDPWAHQ